MCLHADRLDVMSFGGLQVGMAQEIGRDADLVTRCGGPDWQVFMSRMPRASRSVAGTMRDSLSREGVAVRLRCL